MYQIKDHNIYLISDNSTLTTTLIISLKTFSIIKVMLLISIVHFLSSYNIMKLCNIVISMQVIMNNYLNLNNTSGNVHPLKLLTIFDYLSLALGYILQIWLTGLPFTIFAGLVNSTTLHNWVLVVLASLSIPSFPFLL